MESRKYGISTSGSDGKHSGQIRKQQYPHDRMDRHDLYKSGDGVYLGPPGTLFISYVKKKAGNL